MAMQCTAHEHACIVRKVVRILLPMSLMALHDISPLAILLPQRDVRNQELPATSVVMHITGRATYLNAERRRKHPLIHLGDSFGKEDSSFAHYSVDPWGQIGCTAPERERPWAQGWGAFGGRRGLKQKLASGALEVPAWWLEYWGTFDDCMSPLDLLIDPLADSPNDRSVAIEFIQYGNQFLLTEAQYAAGYSLLHDICFRNGILCEPPYIRGHEDTDPWGRGTKDGGWDPGARRVAPRFNWGVMFNGLIEASAGMMISTPPRPEWAPHLNTNGNPTG